MGGGLNRVALSLDGGGYPAFPLGTQQRAYHHTEKKINNGADKRSAEKGIG